MSSTNKQLNFFQRALFSDWFCLNSFIIYNFALALTYCFCRALRPVRGENQNFLTSLLSMDTALHQCVVFQIPRNMSEVLKDPCEPSIAQASLLNILVSLSMPLLEALLKTT
jgi:hypothetical protein